MKCRRFCAWLSKWLNGYQEAFGSWFPLEYIIDHNVFLPRSFFLWKTNLLWCKFLLRFKWKMQRKLARWRSFENTQVFLDSKFFFFRRIVLTKEVRWSWKSWDLLDWNKGLLDQRRIVKSSIGHQRLMIMRIGC